MRNLAAPVRFGWLPPRSLDYCLIAFPSEITGYLTSLFGLLSFNCACINALIPLASQGNYYCTVLICILLHSSYWFHVPHIKAIFTCQGLLSMRQWNRGLYISHRSAVVRPSCQDRSGFGLFIFAHVWSWETNIRTTHALTI